jgi:hypothetical protein
VSWVHYSLHYPFLGNGFQHRNYDSLTELHTPNITHGLLFTVALLQLTLFFPASRTELNSQLNWVKSQSYFTTGGYHQSVRLGVKPLEIHDHRLFQLNSCGNSPYVKSSLMRKWVRQMSLRQLLGTDQTENTVSNSNFIVAEARCLFRGLCLATGLC